MQPGVLYGIGVGPGDPELITMKGAKILARCKHVFVPVTRREKKSTALAIAFPHIEAGSQIHELVFPMKTDRAELERHWDEAAEHIAAVVRTGEDASFLTLGDPFLYSTYIYLLRALRKQDKVIKVITIPGVTSFSAAAALTEFAVGEGTETVTIVPTADNIEAVREALKRGGTVVLMKVGRHLQDVLALLDEFNLMDQGVFVSRAGLDGEVTEMNLHELRKQSQETSYFSILLIHTGNSSAAEGK